MLLGDGLEVGSLPGGDELLVFFDASGRLGVPCVRLETWSSELDIGQSVVKVIMSNYGSLLVPII